MVGKRNQINDSNGLVL